MESLPAHKRFLWVGKLSDELYQTQIKNPNPCKPFEVKIMTGDKLVLYTDGITESTVSESLLNEEGLSDIIQKHGENTVTKLIDNINEETINYKTNDDITLFVTEFKG